jgi:outer membrane protein TolC
MVSVTEAILLGLERNQELRIQRLNPRIRRTGEDVERAAFDPTLTASFSASRDRTEREAKGTGGTVETTTKRTGGSVGITEFLPTGTNIDVGASADRTWSTGAGSSDVSRADISITQALLRGGGWNALSVNLASLRQARLATQISEYELRGFAESLLARIEETYWDYALAQRQIEIFTDSLNIAKDQLREVEERIVIGKLADIERAAAQAEVALREEDLINARSTLAKTRLTLLRSLNPSGENLWNRDVVLRDQPTTTNIQLDDVEAHVQVALRMRPDLNQARLNIQSGDLDIVKTRNGLLPRLDLFITLGRTGYAESFGGSVRAADGHTYDGSVGANFDYPLLNRAPRARYERSKFSLDQLQESLRNMEQLAQVDIRTAYIEVARLQEQIVATAATRRLQEETLRSETEKFRVGKSTTLLVARAQRDLLSARIDEIRAVVSHLKALTELYRLEGSILERRGISAPGGQPVSELSPPKR